VCLGVFWIGSLAWSTWLGFPIRGLCGAPPPWASGHTLVVLLAVVWLLARPTLRRPTQVPAPLVAIHAAPVVVASLIMALATDALLQPGHASCSFSYQPPPIPWWASWHYFFAYGVGIVVALSGTSR